MTETWRPAAVRGFAWGALAGLALVALMYVAGVFLGLRPLPQALSGPILALMPGFVFGFLIDTLQHAGKVVEEFGLIVAMIVGLGVLGAGWAVASRRWRLAQSALVFAAAGWLVVVAALLPISGDGFLGLTDGPTTPIIWALLFAIYGLILQMGTPRSLPDQADPGRRRTIRAVPLAIGAASLGVLGLRLLPDWYQAIFNPPEAGLRGLSMEITPIENFYIVSKNFGDPVVDEHGWSLAMTLINGAPEILVAYDLDGAPLPNAHGFPARIVLPGHYGMKGPKWLDSIQLVDHESGGYWEMQGWDHNAVVKTTARFDVPRDGDIVKLGTVSLNGVAFAGTRGVNKVEYSTDGGKSWTAADFKPPLSQLTWVLWSAAWTPGGEGSYKLQVRTTDGSGSPQDPKDSPSYPNGAAGYHTIRINVAKS